MRRNTGIVQISMLVKLVDNEIYFGGDVITRAGANALRFFMLISGWFIGPMGALIGIAIRNPFGIACAIFGIIIIRWAKSIKKALDQQKKTAEEIEA